jgi:hypothetical protein
MKMENIIIAERGKTQMAGPSLFKHAVETMAASVTVAINIKICNP